ncbi:hypothetical protein CIW54_09640 [Paraburkholderia sp. T12-10]|nr:hypothetical protein CIW54_09640 [Paraburkholderia sp. T12-10]
MLHRRDIFWRTNVANTLKKSRRFGAMSRRDVAAKPLRAPLPHTKMRIRQDGMRGGKHPADR